jgi:hypothetical protein
VSAKPVALYKDFSENVWLTKMDSLIPRPGSTKAADDMVHQRSKTPIRTEQERTQEFDMIGKGL